MKNIFVISLFLFSLAGNAVSPHPLTSTTPVNNDLGLQFMQGVVDLEKAADAKNIMLSPLSYYVALSMAYNGTDGATRKQMSKMIGGGSSLMSFNQNLEQFQKYLRAERPQAEMSRRHRGPKSPIVGIHNSAWHTNVKTSTGGSFNFAPKYSADLKGYFDAEVKGLDFTNEKSAKVINNWADVKTKGLIKSVITSDVLQELVWLLMNATYLEANWAKPFDKVFSVKMKKFETLDGTQLTVDKITRESHAAVASNASMDAVEIPFYDRNGSDLSFYLIVPKSISDFKAMKKSGNVWSKKFWNDLRKDLADRSSVKYTQITMPKFTFDYTVKMKKNQDLTRKLGLNFLFLGNANFSAMASQNSVPSAVGYIKQDTKIELDQFGVKAAAVTTIGGMEITSVRPDPVIEATIDADKPFFFAIGSKSSGALLFLGQVIDPTL